MKPRIKILTIALLALAASGQQAVFKSSTSLVVLDVTVKDRSGKEITGLKKEDFVVLEDGKPQTVNVFEKQKLAGEPLPALAEPPKEATKPAPKPADVKAAVAKAQTINTVAPGKIQ